MKNKNELIKSAMKALVDATIVKDNSAPRGYNGALASFGASLIQSGLLATLAIYSHDSGDIDRTKILKALDSMMQAQGYATNANLYDYARGLQDPVQLLLLERRIAEAAVALKLALRTFQLTAK